MKNILFLFAVIVSFTFSLNAQSLEWAKYNEGRVFQYSKPIFIDDSGNVYTTGYFQGTKDFDPGLGTFYLTSIGFMDVFVLKLDVDGNFVWAISIGGVVDEYGFSIAVDTSGNVYITGAFCVTVDFDPGPGTFVITPVTEEIFMLKLDASGSFVWAKSFGGTGYDRCYSIVVDDSSNIYSIGFFEDTVDFDPGVSVYNISAVNGPDIFILKLNSSGNFVWAKSFVGSEAIYAHDITLDNAGYIYTTGIIQGDVDFDPGTGIYNLSPSGPNAFISKLDNSGNFVYAKSMGGTISAADGFSISVDSSSNAFVTGFFMGTIDFDPGIGTYNITSSGGRDIFISKLDSLGNFVWAKSIGGVDSDEGFSIANDPSGNVYITGYFKGTVDFDPGPGTFNLTPVGYNDFFILKLDAYGDFVYANSIGGAANDYGIKIDIGPSESVYVIGYYTDTVDFDPGPGILYQTSCYLCANNFMIKIKQKGITGLIFNDINHNCVKDTNEVRLRNRHICIYPGNIISQTNEIGIWVIDSLPTGTYTAIYDTSGNWRSTCPVVQSFTVSNPDEITFVPDFGLVSTQPCASPEVTINMPFMRPCFSNQLIFVTACNQYVATGVLDSVYVDVELDSLIIPQSSSLAYTSLGNYTYRFQIGNLYPGQCVNFTVSCNISCSADLGQTLCIQANLYPADSCVFDTIPNPYPGGVTPCTLPWDHSSLQVEGYCQNDSIYFIVHNTGSPINGNMQCWAPVRIYVDGYLVELDSVMIAGGDSVVFAFDGDGRTWRLEADQHPLHPGNSHPNATVELCGDSTNWTPGLVNVLPQNDSDPVVDIYCGVVTGSYDPNDKTGFPTGVDYYHYILPNQQIQYVVRFQNTGTDTAFTVIVRDTLDTDLDIFSVTPGVASHEYSFYMHGPRVLEWTFYNIMLPDSNVNQEASHGFLTFTVDQNADLPDGTVINNSADIYFDFNAPVITNQTIHTVNENMQLVVHQNTVSNKNIYLNIYPNPSDNTVFVDCNSLLKGSLLYIYDVNGALRQTIPVTSEIMQVDVSRLSKGVYIVKSVNENDVAVAKMVVR